jgi:hypothetical protein
MDMTVNELKDKLGVAKNKRLKKCELVKLYMKMKKIIRIQVWN